MQNSKVFYHDLLNLSDLSKHLSQVNLSLQERDELLGIVHHTIHLEVVNFVLTRLPQEEHETFLAHIERRPHDKGIWVYLKRSIRELESDLVDLIHRVKQDFISELRDYKEASEEWLGVNQNAKFQT